MLNLNPLERTIEAKFVRECKKRNWLCLKMNVVGRRGYPDRLVVRKDGLHAWVELKRIGGILSEGQKASIELLIEHNCEVSVCYTSEDAIDWVERLT